jgi:hypothetical protein
MPPLRRPHLSLLSWVGVARTLAFG